MNEIPVFNMTNFFNRELFMYSLGDIKFKKPHSLKTVAYIVVMFIIWTLPLILIFGVHLNVWFVAIAVGPPFLIGRIASKPIWNGRGLLDFLKVSFNFLKEPKGWTDLKATNTLDREVFKTESEIWISRRRELEKLADLAEEDKRSTNK